MTCVGIGFQKVSKKHFACFPVCRLTVFLNPTAFMEKRITGHRPLMSFDRLCYGVCIVHVRVCHSKSPILGRWQSAANSQRKKVSYLSTSEVLIFLYVHVLIDLQNRYSWWVEPCSMFCSYPGEMIQIDTCYN